MASRQESEQVVREFQTAFDSVKDFATNDRHVRCVILYGKGTPS